MADAISVAVRAGRVVESRAPGPRGRRARRRGRRRARRPGARRLHALVGEAVPGAAARARARRPATTATSRSRAPRTRRARAARRGPRAARAAPASTRTSSSAAPERGSRCATTAPASTPGCSPSAAARGWPTRGLPARRTTRSSRAAAPSSRRRPRWRRTSSPTAVDGCGVVDLRAPARADGAHVRAARASSSGGRRASPRRCARTRSSIRGAAAADTVLMRALPGWVAKGGAEGLLCAAGPDGLGVALKVEDGARDRAATRSAAFLARLGRSPSSRSPRCRTQPRRASSAKSYAA